VKNLSETSFLGRLAESRGSGIVKHQVSIGEVVNQHQIMLLAKAAADLKKEKVRSRWWGGGLNTIIRD